MINTYDFDICAMTTFINQAMKMRELNDVIAFIKDTIPCQLFSRVVTSSSTELHLYDVEFFGGHFKEVIIDVDNDPNSKFCNRATIRWKALTIKEPVSVGVNDYIYEYTKSTTFEVDAII